MNFHKQFIPMSYLPWMKKNIAILPCTVFFCWRVYYDFSAGIGRTGTFLAVDYLLEQAKAEGVVDVVKYTYLMRSNRMNMIQTPVSL